MLHYSDRPELAEPWWSGEMARGGGGGRGRLGRKRMRSLLGRGNWESAEDRPALPGSKLRREGKEFQ